MLYMFGLGALVGLIVGVPFGWTTNGIFRSHLDIKKTKAAIPGMRRHRWARVKAAMTAITVTVIVAAVAAATLTHTDPPAATTGPSPAPSSR